MTRLLVSVRDLEEAQRAIEGGAAIVDLKEPRHGSLGACPDAVWQEVATVYRGRLPLSVAQGELRQLPPACSPHALQGIQFAKVGLSGMSSAIDWPAQWFRWYQAMKEHVEPVAVAYADCVTAESPKADEILQVAADQGAGVFLIDTYHKNGTNVFAHLSVDELSKLFARARQYQMTTVLAGSLRASDVADAVRTRPDVIAVRGAACSGERTGSIETERVRRLVDLLRPAARGASSRL